MLNLGCKGSVSLQLLLRIATWPNVEAISSCPVRKKSTDEIFQHFIALHLQKTKVTSRKRLDLEIFKNNFRWLESSKSRFKLLQLYVCVSDVGYDL